MSSQMPLSFQHPDKDFNATDNDLREVYNYTKRFKYSSIRQPGTMFDTEARNLLDHGFLPTAPGAGPDAEQTRSQHARVRTAIDGLFKLGKLIAKNDIPRTIGLGTEPRDATWSLAESQFNSALYRVIVALVPDEDAFRQLIHLGKDASIRWMSETGGELTSAGSSTKAKEAASVVWSVVSTLWMVVWASRLDSYYAYEEMSKYRYGTNYQMRPDVDYTRAGFKVVSWFEISSVLENIELDFVGIDKANPSVEWRFNSRFYHCRDRRDDSVCPWANFSQRVRMHRDAGDDRLKNCSGHPVDPVGRLQTTIATILTIARMAERVKIEAVKDEADRVLFNLGGVPSILADLVETPSRIEVMLGPAADWSKKQARLVKDVMSTVKHRFIRPKTPDDDGAEREEEAARALWERLSLIIKIYDNLKLSLSHNAVRCMIDARDNCPPGPKVSLPNSYTVPQSALPF